MHVRLFLTSILLKITFNIITVTNRYEIIIIIIFFYWRYNPLWVLAFSVIFFHSS